MTTLLYLRWCQWLLFVSFLVQRSVTSTSILRKQQQQQQQKQQQDEQSLSISERSSSNSETSSSSMNEKQQQQHDEEDDRELQPRIVGGRLAAKGEYPWYGVPAQTWYCGSALIWPDVMLTAAHCCEFYNNGIKIGAFDYGVKIGATNLYTTDYSDIIPVQKYHLHPLFNNITTVNDICLMKLLRVPTTPIPTVKWNKMRNFPKNNSLLRVMGFGYQNEDASSVSPVLLKVGVRMVDFDTCLKAFEGYNEGEVLTRNRMICAGWLGIGGKDACLGDSGGPLLAQKRVFDIKIQKNVTLNTIVGIISWGDGCAKPDRPGVYTQVNTYSRWIQNTLCKITSVPCPTRTPVTGTPAIAPKPVTSTPALVSQPTIPAPVVKRKWDDIFNPKSRSNP